MDWRYKKLYDMGLISNSHVSDIISMSLEFYIKGLSFG